MSGRQLARVDLHGEGRILVVTNMEANETHARISQALLSGLGAEG
jgi:hypothetical protein